MARYSLLPRGAKSQPSTRKLLFLRSSKSERPGNVSSSMAPQHVGIPTSAVSNQASQEGSHMTRPSSVSRAEIDPTEPALSPPLADLDDITTDLVFKESASKNSLLLQEHTEEQAPRVGHVPAPLLGVVGLSNLWCQLTSALKRADDLETQVLCPRCPKHPTGPFPASPTSQHFRRAFCIS